MSLFKIKNPVEYSFLQWINNNPDSLHWTDMERFYCFVKTVCSFNAKNWKDANFLKEKILRVNSNFDQKALKYLLELYIVLLDFNKIKACSSQFQQSDRKIKNGYYTEIRVTNGVIKEKEKPITN